MTRLLRTSLLISACSALVGALFSSACGGANNSAGLIAGDGGSGSMTGTGSASSSGGSTSSAGAGGGEGGDGPVGPLPCESAGDCSPSTPVCHSTRSTCVECEVPADCGTAGALCEANVCVEQTPCQSSNDCPGSLLCDDASGFCVECLGTADCVDAAKICVQNACELKCQSDVTCKSAGLVCDLGQGFCVECVDSNDCADDEFCDAGACQADVCTAGSTACQGDAVHQCNADGSAFPLLETCSDGCEVDGPGAKCTEPPTPTACGDLNLIDDMEDGNTTVCANGGRNGSFFTRQDGYSSITMVDLAVAQLVPARGTSQYGVHFSGSAPGTSWGALLGMRFKTLGQVVDGSQYTGIKFWAKGSSLLPLRVQVQNLSMATSTDGGTCLDSASVACSGYHAADAGTLTSAWQEYTVSFANLTQPVWAAPQVAFNKTQLVGVTFWAPNGSGTYDVWIDDVRFY